MEKRTAATAQGLPVTKPFVCCVCTQKIVRTAIRMESCINDASQYRADKRSHRCYLYVVRRTLNESISELIQYPLKYYKRALFFSSSLLLLLSHILTLTTVAHRTRVASRIFLHINSILGVFALILTHGTWSTAQQQRTRMSSWNGRNESVARKTK